MPSNHEPIETAFEPPTATPRLFSGQAERKARYIQTSSPEPRPNYQLPFSPTPQRLSPDGLLLITCTQSRRVGQLLHEIFQSHTDCPQYCNRHDHYPNHLHEHLPPATASSAASSINPSIRPSIHPSIHQSIIIIIIIIITIITIITITIYFLGVVVKVFFMSSRTITQARTRQNHPQSDSHRPHEHH